jgi:hypothetical protein
MFPQQHTRGVLLLVLAMGFSAIAGTAWGAEETDQREQKEYDIGIKQAKQYFMALYTALGTHYRTKAILKACGHQAEANAIHVRGNNAAKSRIDAMVTADIDKKILRSPIAIFVAAEGATSMLIGYALGYEEGLAMVKDGPSWYRDALCNVGWENSIPDTLDRREPRTR